MDIKMKAVRGYSAFKDSYDPWDIYVTSVKRSSLRNQTWLVSYKR